MMFPEEQTPLTLLSITRSMDFPQGRRNPREALQDKVESSTSKYLVAAMLAVIMEDKGTTKKLNREGREAFEKAVKQPQGGMLLGSREEGGASVKGRGEGGAEPIYRHR
ncbi:MAG: hypothetical protein RMJ98_00545 [Myxococcales bacterium]|nr:hypothetical protein [Polyangiaceae bacterium]MDW8247774.1 hypothetical protein [Myxococcales bacterium]